MMLKAPVSAILGLLLTCFWTPAALGEDLMPKITRWYDNKKAAVSLRFDDSLESHVRTVIPLLDSFGIRATFMVNPGRASFKRHENFWTRDAIAAGHNLGNHTMNHRGARTLAEAEYEIGETARIIREFYPDRSPLMVFASGGGEKWGGRKWSEADDQFRDLPASYDLIDLYDGTHSYVSGRSDQTAQTLYNHVEKAMEEGLHQAFLFHQVGSPRLIDRGRKFLTGRADVISVAEYRAFLELLSERREELWIAPLIEIIKYERERLASSIVGVEVSQNKIVFRLKVETDSSFYDHPLSCLIENAPVLERVTQDGRQIDHRVGDSGLWLNLAPESSEVTVFFQED